ncbi:hypothetical protein [Methylomicrobium agile]|uniref:hypothetical protein n=1 Tax=Methylomicrobium agile TaxID=39774 RepID=UPI0004DF8E09|nr:hypothetical protein [Methylomicrobium agile]
MNDDSYNTNRVLRVLGRLEEGIQEKWNKEKFSKLDELLKDFSQHLQEPAYVTNAFNKKGELISAIQCKINDLQKDVTEQLEKEEEEMVSENVAMSIGVKLFIAGGSLLVLGIAMYYWANNTKSARLGHTSSGKGRNIQPQSPDYQPHHLLLILPANQLAGFSASQTNQIVTKNQIEQLIKNAVRAYCYPERDPDVNTIDERVICTDEELDTTSESRFFLRVKLLAEPSIKNDRSKLGIIGKIKPDPSAEILKLARFRASDSTQPFFPL